MEKGILKLEIFTWQGVSLGAIHYYGVFHSWDWQRDSGNRIEHILTEREAAKTNAARRQMFSDEYAESTKSIPGESSDGFDTAEDVITHAKEIWLNNYPDAERLVDYSDPNKVYAINSNPIEYIPPNPVELSQPESESILPIPTKLIPPEPIKPKRTKQRKSRIQDFPSIEVTVKLYDTHAEIGKPGIAVFQAFCTDVSDDDGNDLGSIGGGTGAVVVSIHNGPYFLLPHDELWNAVQQKLESTK